MLECVQFHTNKSMLRSGEMFQSGDLEKCKQFRLRTLSIESCCFDRPTHVFWPQRDCWSIATCHSNLFMDAIRFFNKSHDSHLCNPLQYINNKWMRAVKMHTANAVSRCSASCCEVNESGFARERLRKKIRAHLVHSTVSVDLDDMKSRF